MDDLKSLIEMLKAAGFAPKVNLTVPPNTTDIEAIKALQASLLSAGITPEIHINLGIGEVAEPGTGPIPDTTGEKRFAVIVSDEKLNCFIFKKRDDAGKPIFIIREPRVQLFQGERFFVSSEHRESEKDPGDGTIIGTGGIRFYFIVDCPSKPEAVGMFVRQSEVIPG
jgi:hypothetical protein